MNASLNLGTYAGIHVRVHWSFALLIGFILYSGFAAGGSAVNVLFDVLFILALFACVVLHEFGHALAARSFGIPTRDITLLPIGGVARLARMPRKPSQEFIVAVAGPAVNVVIAGLLAAILIPTMGLPLEMSTQVSAGNFLPQLLWTNIALVVFNMLPAFPMDGGRVLRSLLAMFTDYAAATRMAALIGQMFAGLFALLGFFNPFMFLLAAFIFFAATAESRSVQVQERLRGFTVSDGMLRNFKAVPSWFQVSDAAEILLGGSQRAVPVIENRALVGMLFRDDVTRAMQSHQAAQPVSTAMRTSVSPVSPSDPILDLIEENPTAHVRPVVADGQVVGLFDLQAAGELISARAHQRAEQPILATLVDSPASMADSIAGEPKRP